MEQSNTEGTEGSDPRRWAVPVARIFATLSAPVQVAVVIILCTAALGYVYLHERDSSLQSVTCTIVNSPGASCTGPAKNPW